MGLCEIAKEIIGSVLGSKTSGEGYLRCKVTGNFKGGGLGLAKWTALVRLARNILTTDFKAITEQSSGVGTVRVEIDFQSPTPRSEPG